MKRRGDRTIGKRGIVLRSLVFMSMLVPTAGCAPVIDVAGVYFPGWLVSAVAGLVAAYALVWWLGRRPGARALAQSGLLFCSLTVTVALLVWWIFFSAF